MSPQRPVYVSSREWIKDDKDDSLDISWFGTANELPDPTVLAQEAMVELEAAMTELRGIMAELGMVVEA
ncbi:MAG: hypothetical protein WC156_02945 [Pedobacter sp.]